MDCVTCILVGMCVMCGPGFGAKSLGRHMTESELTQVLENMLRRFQTNRKPPVLTSGKSYTRRQSFIPDIRFTDIGIGKRGGNYLSMHPPYQGYRFGSNGYQFQPFRSPSIISGPGFGVNRLGPENRIEQMMPPAFADDDDDAKEDDEVVDSLEVGTTNSDEEGKYLAKERAETGDDDRSVRTSKVDTLLNDIIKTSGLTFRNLMNKLKRNKLEQLLRRTIAEGNRLAAEIGEMKKGGNDDNGIKNSPLETLKDDASLVKCN